jgi:hypothetical protein
MAARDDFGSGARSPGGWGGQGNMRTTVGGGGHGSLGTASGSNASGMGGMGGVGGGYGYSIINPNAAAYVGSGGGGGGLLANPDVVYPSMPRKNPAQQLPPSTLGPAALPTALTNAAQYANPFRWPTQRRADMAQNPQFPYNNGYNGRPAANYPPTPTWAGGPTYNANVGGLVGGSGGPAMGGGWNPNSGQFGGVR